MSLVIEDRRNDGLSPPLSQYYDVLIKLGDLIAAQFAGTIEEQPAHTLSGVPPKDRQFLNALRRIYQAFETAQGGVVDMTVDNGARLLVQALENALLAHINTITNPHSVTKAQVGLGAVDNTPDANKPVSSAQAQAITTAQQQEQERAAAAETFLQNLINALDNNLTALLGQIATAQSTAEARVPKTDVVNNFSSTDNTKVLSANAGRLLYELLQAGGSSGGSGSGVDEIARLMAEAAQQTADQKLDEQPDGTHPLIAENGQIAQTYLPAPRDFTVARVNLETETGTWEFNTDTLDESLTPYAPGTPVVTMPLLGGLVSIVGKLQGMVKWIGRSAGFATAAQGTKADSAVQPAELDAALDMKQDTLSDEQLATVNGDPFAAVNYSTTAQMTQAINDALESAEVKGVIKFRGYFSTSAPTQPAPDDLWVQGTRPAAPDFTGVTVKQWNGIAWSTTTYTPGIFHLWSDLNEGGKGYYLFPLDEWNHLDFAIDLEPYALKEWVFTQLANYQATLTPEQLAAGNSGITASILAELQNFKNRTAGFATSAQGTLADNAQPKLTATGATNLLTAPASAGGQPGTKAITDFVQKSEVVNSAAYTSTNLPLSAAQSKALADTKQDATITLADNAAATTLPTTSSGTLLSKVQALRDNVKALFSYFTSGKANSAATADKLATARTVAISGKASGTATSFDGSGNISIPITALSQTPSDYPTLNQSTTGNAATATKIASARTLAADPTATAAGSFDGSANVSIGIAPNLTDSTAASTLPTVGAATALTTLLNTIRNCLKWLVARFDASGNANAALKLTTARTIQTNLGSTATASFDGSANVTPGITGTLPVANGGTNATTVEGAGASLQTYRKIAYLSDSRYVSITLSSTTSDSGQLIYRSNDNVKWFDISLRNSQAAASITAGNFMPGIKRVSTTNIIVDAGGTGQYGVWSYAPGQDNNTVTMSASTQTAYDAGTTLTVTDRRYSALNRTISYGGKLTGTAITDTGGNISISPASVTDATKWTTPRTITTKTIDSELLPQQTLGTMAIDGSADVTSYLKNPSWVNVAQDTVFNFINNGFDVKPFIQDPDRVTDILLELIIGYKSSIDYVQNNIQLLIPYAQLMSAYTNLKPLAGISGVFADAGGVLGSPNTAYLFSMPLSLDGFSLTADGHLTATVLNTGITHGNTYDKSANIFVRLWGK